VSAPKPDVWKDSLIRQVAGRMVTAQTMPWVGRTRIMCVRQPCPWRGILEATADGVPAARPPHWSGNVLPPLVGKEADASRVRKAWEDSGCLLIKGRFLGERLQIHRIVGMC
jgi:hypothetical protein